MPSPPRALATAPARTASLAVSRFADVRDPWPKLRPAPWTTFAAQLREHDRRPGKDGPLFSPCAYPPGARRGGGAVTHLSMLVVEYDGRTPDFRLLEASRLTGVAFSTYSHWVEDERHPVPGPHHRVVLPLAVDVPAVAWPETYARALLVFPGADPACRDAARMQYFPACPVAPAAAPEVWAQDTGRWLDPASLPPLPPGPGPLGIPRPRPSGALPLDDRELLERARAAANGAKFDRLWRGDSADARGDASAGDLSLVCVLLFWTGQDAPRAERLFRQSGRYRPKWDAVHYADGRTYGQATLDRAVRLGGPAYAPGASVVNTGVNTKFLGYVRRTQFSVPGTSVPAAVGPR